MYKAPRVHEPSKELLKEKAKDLNLDVTDTDLTVYKDLIDHWLESYNRVLELAEPLLPVKYPRMNPVQPSPEDNLHNAWAHKITINGASSGILLGKTVAIKDCIPIYGVPMVNGTNLLYKYTPDFDSTVITRILDAGGVIKGTTNCEDMCFSGSSLTCCRGPVLNPVDKTRSAGGSSSGSAVVVALGEVDMALGGDQGGSIRIPSSWCGTVGLKPTYGLVPYTGISSIEPSVDHVGPMAKTVKDCALLLQAIAGDDNGLDHRQRNLPPPIDYISQLQIKDSSTLRVGVVPEGFEGCDKEVIDVVNAMVERLKTVTSVSTKSLPFHKDSIHVWSPVCLEGAYKTMLAHGAAGTGHKGFYPTSLMEHLSKSYETSKNDMSFIMKPLCLFGKYMEDSYHGRFYSIAHNLVTQFTQRYNEGLDNLDVLVMPTLPYTSPKLPASDVSETDRIHHALGMIKNTAPFNATGHPALTINAGFTTGGLPVGIMIVGRHFEDLKVLQVAQVVEELTVKKS